MLLLLLIMLLFMFSFLLSNVVAVDDKDAVVVVVVDGGDFERGHSLFVVSLFSFRENKNYHIICLGPANIIFMFHGTDDSLSTSGADAPLADYTIF